MKPAINIITPAVGDLERALRFYRDSLGLDSPGIKGEEFLGDERQAAGAVAMFELANGVILALYPRTELSKDAGVPVGPAKTGEFSIGQRGGSHSKRCHRIPDSAGKRPVMREFVHQRQ